MTWPRRRSWPTLPQPWGWEGPSPEDKWRERAPIEDAERSELANELARH